jgi:hypothetical protein
MSDAQKLTEQLEAAGAIRSHVIKIINGYGDAIDWGADPLVEIIGTVWESDLNSGDEPDGWIINEICRTFNVPEVKE